MKTAGAAALLVLGAAGSSPSGAADAPPDLGPAVRAVVQGVHAHHPRRARGCHRGGPSARPQGHRASLLGDIPGGYRARHR